MIQTPRALPLRIRRVLSLITIVALTLPLSPLEAAAAADSPSLAPALVDSVLTSAAVSPGLPVGAELPGLAPAPQWAAPPAPQSLGGSASYNWSPYAPPAFTWGTVDLIMRTGSVAVGGLPNVATTQTGNVMLTLSGSWNPAPPTANERDWVTLISVFNGRASVRTLESNTTLRITVTASQLPARFFFALPSPVNFVAGTSSARVEAVVPGGGLTRLNLPVAAAGLNLTQMEAVAPIPTSSVWFNSSGNYTPVGYLNATQNITVVAPMNGLPAFAVGEGQVTQWTGPGTFAGARAFLLANGTSNQNVGTTLSMWTRGSPESGLFINATAAPINTSRGSNVTVSGLVGNRTLAASTNWTVNTTSVLAPNHGRENCTNLIRLQNGSWRLFCNFFTYGANNTSTWGVDSAFSTDGLSWAWEPGVRYAYCMGTLEIDQATMFRLLDGSLLMYYTGRNPQGCDNIPTTHVEFAFSRDEGWTWERIGAGNDVEEVVFVPTPHGGLRFYYRNGTTVGTGFFDAVSFSFDGPNITANMPRSVYLLSDGSYKMYFGTTSVYSSTSANGVNWTSPALEVASWGGDIEAGPLLDRGDGALLMLLYSQASGLYLARQGGSDATTPVALGGQMADGRLTGTAAVSSASGGAFQGDVPIPDSSPLGRLRVSAATWFGNVSLPGLVLNRPPTWVGPSTITAFEEEALTLDLANWAVELDSADALVILANSSYGVLAGHNLTLFYPNGVLFDHVTGNATDGFETLFFEFYVNVTPFDDPPVIELDPVYYFIEDQQSTLDLTGRYSDEETPNASLALATDLAGATVQPPYITFNITVPGAFNVTVSVFDGAKVGSATTQFVVVAVDDVPTLVVAPRYTFFEGQPGVIDLTGAYADEETNASDLVLTTNLSIATVTAPLILVNTSVAGDFDTLVAVSDGNHTVAALTQVIVAAVDDSPVIDALPQFSANESELTTLHFGAFIHDEDTPLSDLVLTTDLPGAAVDGLNISVSLSEARLWFFELRVSDGNTTASRAAQIDVVAVNDGPSWTGLADSLEAVEGEVLRINLSLFVSDPDNATGDLLFTATSAYARMNGTFLELLYPNGVLSDLLTIRVSDGRLWDERTIPVTVLPYNSPPVLSGNPPSELSPGANVTFAFTGTDVETPGSLAFALSSNVSWITITRAGLLVLSPPPGTQGHFWYDVVLSDGDGGFDGRTFEVGVDNHAPTIGEFNRSASPNVVFTAFVPVEDADGDPVTVTLTSDVPAISFDPQTRVISWLPSYAYSPGTGLDVVVNITITASDGVALTTLKTAIRVRDPPDKPPFITGNFDDVRGYAGQAFSIDLRALASDPDDLLTNLTWRIVSDLAGAVAQWNYDPSSGVLHVTLRGPGQGNLTVLLIDPSGLSDSQTIHVETLPVPHAAPPASDGFPWWLLLLLAAGAGVGIAVARRRAGAVASTARAASGASGLAAPASARGAKYLVENVFLLTLDGRPVFTHGGVGMAAEQDQDILGSMLVAVQEFAKDAFRSGSPVHRMSYGDDTVLLERGRSVILAVTVFGEPTRQLRELMSEAVGKVERTFAGVIEDWDGDREMLAGLEDVLAPLWLSSQALTRDDVIASTRGTGVEMLSAIEFFQGYLRVKIGIVNNTPEMINNATIDLDYNADALRLIKFEPPTYRSAGSRVIIGSVARGEKIAIAYYLDPQICTTSVIDATCVYKDLSGAQHAVEMKSRKAEIVCPLFFTKEQANSALLKRLIETQLSQYDARGYTYKAGTNEDELQRLFEFMKSAVLSHDIQLVRSFEKRHPYAAEAWFYGKTKGKGHQMVIRAAVNQAKGRSEFFVASKDIAPITGLLAELHHTLTVRASSAADGVSIQALFDESLRSEYANRSLLSKVLEGEADPGDSEEGS